MDYMTWFPQRVAELRLQRDVSARDMSLSLGQSESYINKIENGRMLPSMAGFFYICEYFAITPRDFFDAGLPASRAAGPGWEALDKLTPAQAGHILPVVREVAEK